MGERKDLKKGVGEGEKGRVDVNKRKGEWRGQVRGREGEEGIEGERERGEKYSKNRCDLHNRSHQQHFYL